MNVRSLSLIPLTALLAATALAQGTRPTPPPVTLHIGDAAPPITVVKWLKGTPQTDVNDGKVHVFEFWATWCGPCKVGMPHLSELAKHYGKKVAFVGVDSSEAKDDSALPEKFVAQAGKMMDYNVAYATPRGPMTTAWMQAAGQNGIPCAFVVDKHGKIAWIGHPLMGLEEALDLAIDDKLTADAAASIDAGWKTKLAKGEEVMKSLAQATKDGKTDEAIALNEQAYENWPFIAPQYASTKYELLAAKDASAASKFGNSLLKDKANAPLVLRQVATSITNEKSNLKGDRDYKLAMNLLKKSNECMAPSYSSSLALATAASKAGDKSQAVEAQSLAVNLLQESLSTTNYGTSPNGLKAKAALEKMLADAQATLESYKTAQK